MEKRFLNILLLISIILLSFTNIAKITVAKEDYVGINEGEIYSWKATCDEDVYDQYHEDMMTYIGEYDGMDEDDFDDAVELTEGYYDGISIDEDESKYYKVQVVKDKNLTVVANCSYDEDLDLDLYDNDFNRIGQHSSHYHYTADWSKYMAVADTPYTGYYYIKISNDDTSTILYGLNVNITDWSGEDMYEENDEYGDAVYIREDYYFGYLECSYGNEDWYDLSLYEDEVVDLSISFTHSSGDLNLFVYQYDYNEETITLIDSSTGSIDTEEILNLEGDEDLDTLILVNNTTPGSNNQEYSMEISTDDDDNDDDDDDDSSSICGDVEGIRYEIKKIHEEDEHDLYIDEVDGVEVEADLYTTENLADESDWEEEDEITFIIVDPSEDDYYYPLIFSQFITATNIDWEELIEDYLDYVEDVDNYEVEMEIEWNGIRMTIEYDDSDLEIMEHTWRYHSNGVLEYYHFIYDGKTCITYELQGVIPDHYLMIGGIAIAIIAIIAVALFLILRHRS